MSLNEYTLSAIVAVFGLLMLVMTSCSGGHTTVSEEAAMAGDCQSQAVYDKVSAQSALAKQAMERHDYVESVRVIRESISLIGSSYQNPRVIDDSGMAFAYFEAEVSKGELAKAAIIGMGVLETRMTLLQNKLTQCK